jgi:hypothetical protein
LAEGHAALHLFQQLASPRGNLLPPFLRLYKRNRLHSAILSLDCEAAAAACPRVRF